VDGKVIIISTCPAVAGEAAVSCDTVSKRSTSRILQETFHNSLTSLHTLVFSIEPPTMDILRTCFGFHLKWKIRGQNDERAHVVELREKHTQPIERRNVVQNSPLLALPAEIRLIIFEKIVRSEYVLHILARAPFPVSYSKCCDLGVNEIGKEQLYENTQQDSSTIPPSAIALPPKFRSHNSASCNCEDDEAPISPANWLRTCQQIHNEFADLLYSLNTFEFSVCSTFAFNGEL
jgi:hypothetical protein